MSVIVITHHDENIYQISEKCATEGERKPFKIKSRERTKRDTLNKGQLKEHATMGVARESVPDPCDFLKMHTGKPSYSPEEIKASIGKHKCENKKPKFFATPHDVAEYNRRKKEAANAPKNFIGRNIKYVLKMTPKEHVPTVVLDPYGYKKKLSEGLEPIYIRSHTFGKTPTYLQEFIKTMEKEHQMQKDATGVEKPMCRYLRRDKREDLLEGLKHNWEELQKLYQGLPILTDTIPKINRKAKLEAELKQLEKDIVLVERHPYIYLYDDNLVPSN